MENHVIQVDYNPTASQLVGNHSHIIITLSRLATKAAATRYVVIELISP